jgi:hypothetical protein
MKTLPRRRRRRSLLMRPARLRPAETPARFAAPGHICGISLCGVIGYRIKTGPAADGASANARCPHQYFVVMGLLHPKNAMAPSGQTSAQDCHPTQSSWRETDAESTLALICALMTMMPFGQNARNSSQPLHFSLLNLTKICQSLLHSVSIPPARLQGLDSL